MGSLRFVTVGESRGSCLIAVLEGMPPGVPIAQAGLDEESRRRSADGWSQQ
jgi:chorismate synthase